MMSCNVGKRQHDIIEGHCSNTLSMQKPHQMCSMFTDAAHFLMHSSHKKMVRKNHNNQRITTARDAISNCIQH